jgi:hypothetical protein
LSRSRNPYIHSSYVIGLNEQRITFSSEKQDKDCQTTFALVISYRHRRSQRLQTLNAQKLMVNIGSPSGGEVSSRIIGTLLVPGFTNQYNLTMNGKSISIKYSILDGSLVEILSDPSRKSLDLAVNPKSIGGALEVNLPRDLIDSKNAAG